MYLSKWYVAGSLKVERDDMMGQGRRGKSKKTCILCMWWSEVWISNVSLDDLTTRMVPRRSL